MRQIMFVSFCVIVPLAPDPGDATAGDGQGGRQWFDNMDIILNIL